MIIDLRDFTIITDKMTSKLQITNISHSLSLVSVSLIKVLEVFLLYGK